MIFDFINILALLTIFSGVVTLVDFIRTRTQRRALKAEGKPIKYPLIIEYSRSFFPVLLIVLFLRAFLMQPYKVPTGSLEPTVMPGDLIAVNQASYGLKLPLWDVPLLKVGKPQTAQIALVRWPVNPEMTFVKRVVGTPGDKISYINKVLYINGKKQTQTFLGMTEDHEFSPVPVRVYSEILGGYEHKIWRRADRPSVDFKNLVVPKDSYFLMGDNRDNSDDSRGWGFVKRDAFIGRAVVVWMNMRFSPFSIDWHRIGTSLSPKKVTTTKKG